jgi:hypothetical protein
MLSATFLNPTTWLEVQGRTWEQLLPLAGEAGRLVNGKFEFDPFWQSLSATPPAGLLEEAMQTIHALGTDEGRDLIRQAAKDQNVEFNTPDDVPARELAARLWMQSQTSASLAAILVLAKAGVSESSDTRTYREYLGDGPLNGTLDKDRLRQAVLGWIKTHKKHEAVEIFAYQRGSSYFCEVLRGDSMKRVIQIKDQRPALLDFRPAVSDHIRYEPVSGRIAIATRSGQLLEVYRTLLGSMLAGKSEFFSDQNVCTLRPLQEQGSQLFDQHRPPEIHRVDVVELHWRRGDRDRVTVHGKDCFRVLREIGASLQEGELTEAKLRIAFAGHYPTTVNLKVPNRIDIKGIGIHDEVIRRLLSDVGIRGFARAAAVTDTMWSLFPYRLTEYQWRAIVGASFDDMVQGGRLRSVSLEHVTHPDHPGHTQALAVDALADGTRVGISNDLAVPLRSLSPTDYLGYEPDWFVHLGHIASAMGLEGTVQVVEAGLWHLGARSFEPAGSVCVFLATRIPPQQTRLLLDQHSSGAQPMLLIPSDCTCAVPVRSLKISIFAGPFENLTQRMVETLGWKDQLLPRIWAQEKLVIDTTRGIAWYGDQQLTRLKQGTHAYKFAVALTKEEGRVVTKATLNKLLSPAGTEDGIAKTAKSDFKMAVQSSFTAAGRPAPEEAKDIFESRNSGYALNCSGRVV